MVMIPPVPATVCRSVHSGSLSEVLYCTIYDTPFWVVNDQLKLPLLKRGRGTPAPPMTGGKSGLPDPEQVASAMTVRPWQTSAPRAVTVLVVAAATMLVPKLVTVLVLKLVTVLVLKLVTVLVLKLVTVLVLKLVTVLVVKVVTTLVVKVI